MTALAWLNQCLGTPHNSEVPFFLIASASWEQLSIVLRRASPRRGKFLVQSTIERNEANMQTNEAKNNHPADSAVAVLGRIPMFAAATLSRLVFLTKYMASSARCSKPSLVRESTG